LAAILKSKKSSNLTKPESRLTETIGMQVIKIIPRHLILLEEESLILKILQRP